MRLSLLPLSFAIASLFVITSCDTGDVERDVPEQTPGTSAQRMVQFTTAGEYADFTAEGLERWESEVPRIQDIAITSTADSSDQPALFLEADNGEARPLLVVLHSWSAGYLQHIGIPFAQMARENDWHFIHPDYRGTYDSPEATASDLAIQDILDAVQYARDTADVDPSRIYLTGYSGGAMTALVMAGRHPNVWAGVAAWVPIYDLIDWYEYSVDFDDRTYAEEIEASCGGPPAPDNEAGAECLRRSPRSHLSTALDVPLYIAHGIEDDIVPASHSIRAFNDVAAPEDEIDDDHIAYIREQRELPPELMAAEQDNLFGAEDPLVILHRSSQNATLVLFEGGHDMVYNPGVLWLSRQSR